MDDHTPISVSLSELAKEYRVKFGGDGGLRAEYERYCQKYPSLASEKRVSEFVHRNPEGGLECARGLRDLVREYENEECSSSSRFRGLVAKLAGRACQSARRLEKLATRRPPDFEDDDRELARMWAIDWCDEDPPTDRVMNQMLSARHAELAMLEICYKVYGGATDLSVQQLDGADGPWRNADIELRDGQLFDVKNARASVDATKRGCRTYSELFVKRDKQHVDGSTVAIVGMYSPYHNYNSEEYSVPRVTWLGEYSSGVLVDLRAEFESAELVVDLKRPGRAGSFLPPWLFEFPRHCYSERDKFAKALSGRDELPVDSLPISSIAGLSSSPASQEQELLVNRFDEPEMVSRPRVFLHVLARFTAMLTRGMEFDASGLRDSLYFRQVSGSEAPRLLEQFPLGLYDPLCTVWHLINVLERVSSCCVDEARVYRQFRLHGMNILRGVVDPGREEPVYAYCGDCGRNPLHLGQDRQCSCGRLICSSCTYCSRSCMHRSQRAAGGA